MSGVVQKICEDADTTIQQRIEELKEVIASFDEWTAGRDKQSHYSGNSKETIDSLFDLNEQSKEELSNLNLLIKSIEWARQKAGGKALFNIFEGKNAAKTLFDVTPKGRIMVWRNHAYSVPSSFSNKEAWMPLYLEWKKDHDEHERQMKERYPELRKEEIAKDIRLEEEKKKREEYENYHNKNFSVWTKLILVLGAIGIVFIILVF
jgi:hypothetical protein